MKTLDQLNPWELLGLEPGSGPEEVHRAYERLSSRLAPGSLALYSIADRGEQIEFQQRLRAAYLELLDRVARVENPPGSEVPRTPPAHGAADAGTSAPVPSDGGPPTPPAQPVAPGTEFTGEFLRHTREAKGISLEALSHRTRIRRQLLEALEAERFAELPQRVFVRGFIFAIAGELGLDPERVWGSYGRRREAWAGARG